MDTDTQSFPRLPPSIALLVAGHREERLMQHAGYENGDGPAFRTLYAVLDRFAGIHTSAEDVHVLFPSTLYIHRRPVIRIVTGQADGVDRFAMKAAEWLGVPVDLVTPDTLCADYKAIAARSVGFGCPPHRLHTDDAPFAMRDELAFSYADMLVAVWDGGPAHGTAGGVVRLIRRAVQAGLPVLWIDLEGSLRTIAADRITEECLYRLDRRDLEDGLLRTLFTVCDPETGVLIDALRRRLNPLDDKLVVPDRETEMLARYAAEHCGCSFLERRAGCFHETMTALLRLDGHEFLRSVRKLALGERPTEPGDSPAPDMAAKRRLATPDGLQSRFEWCDSRANISGGKHRSSIWVLYLLASAAVFASVMGILKLGFCVCSSIGCVCFCASFWNGVEIVLLLLIVATVFHARFKHWHRIWLGHRFVAEQIRYLRILRPFLAMPAPFQEPLFVHTDVRRTGHRLRSAELWILQRSLSADGLPSYYEGYEFALANRADLASELRQEIGCQSAFHKRTHRHAHRLREVAEDRIPNCLFFLALGCTIGHLALEIMYPQNHSPGMALLQLISASSPALAAALHGVTTKLEIGRVAAQSHKVRSRLVVLESVVTSGMESPNPPDWAAMSGLRADAIEVASLLSRENEQWRNLIRYQETDIPA
ncbi:hypothetical protein ACV229_40125 [Burkholderia sp. MR1-5-21]